MSPDQPEQDTPVQPCEDHPQPQPEAAPESRREGTVIPFPALAGGQVQRAPEVPEGKPEFTRWPMPVVLPPWLHSRQTARATLRWALEYTGRQVTFHAWRAPAYGLALGWWTLRGGGRAIAAGFGWVSVRG